MTFVESLAKVKTSETACRHNCAESVKLAVSRCDIPVEAKALFSISCTCTRDNFESNVGKRYFEKVLSRNGAANDIILFDWDYTGDCDHIGIVTRVENDTVYYDDFNGGSNDRTYGHHYIKVGHPQISALYRYKGSPQSSSSVSSKYTKKSITIQRGDSGNLVKLVQKIVRVTTDGLFGPDTENAVKDFQEHMNIEVDGIVGDETFGAMAKYLDY